MCIGVVTAAIFDTVTAIIFVTAFVAVTTLMIVMAKVITVV
jgi:hypothetical protein